MQSLPDSLEAYRPLAERLDALPNGFPPAPDGAELRLLARLFTPEEARLAAALRLTLETPEQLAARLDLPAAELKDQLRQMSRKGLITAGRAEGGLGFGLMPFVVGIYEAQAGRIDAELARLFEDYFQGAFHQLLAIQPQVHRVVPVNENVRLGMEIRPFESASQIVQALRPGVYWTASVARRKRSSGRPARIRWMCVWCWLPGRVCSTRIR